MGAAIGAVGSFLGTSAGATLGAGALSAGASLIGGLNQAGAQSSAAGTQSAYALQGIQNNKDLIENQALPAFYNSYADATNTIRTNMWDALGSTYNNESAATNAIDTLLSPASDEGIQGGQLLGKLLGTDGGNPQTEAAALAQTPGYQFALQQGLLSTQNSNAAKGLGSSGAALGGAANYASGLASQTYQGLVGDAQNMWATGTNAGLNQASDLANNFANTNNTVASIYNAGSNAYGNATSALAGIGANLYSNLGSMDSNLLVGAGNALAAGTVGSASALGSGFNGVGNAAQSGVQNYNLLQAIIAGQKNNTNNPQATVS